MIILTDLTKDKPKECLTKKAFFRTIPMQKLEGPYDVTAFLKSEMGEKWATGQDALKNFFLEQHGTLPDRRFWSGFALNWQNYFSFGYMSFDS